MSRSREYSGCTFTISYPDLSKIDLHIVVPPNWVLWKNIRGKISQEGGSLGYIRRLEGFLFFVWAAKKAQVNQQVAVTCPGEPKKPTQTTITGEMHPRYKSYGAVCGKQLAVRESEGERDGEIEKKRE